MKAGQYVGKVSHGVSVAEAGVHRAVRMGGIEGTDVRAAVPGGRQPLSS